MSNTRPSWFKWSIISVALAAVAALCISVRAQEAAEPAAPNTGYVDDWTHHHVVFSNPGTREDAVRNGTLDKWTRITNDPRYKLQQLKRNLGTRPVVADTDPGFGPGGFLDARGPRRDRGPQDLVPTGGVKKDWSSPLGGAPPVPTGGEGGTIGTLNTSTIGANSTLYIIFAQPGRGFFGFDFEAVQASPPTSATLTGTFTGEPTSGQTVTITNGATNTLILTAGGSSTTGTATFSGNPANGSRITVGGTTYTWLVGYGNHGAGDCGTTTPNCIIIGQTAAEDAENLEAAINDDPAECGFNNGGFYGRACFFNVTAANTSASAVVASNVTTIINDTAGSIVFTTTSGAITLSGGGTIAGSTVSNSCSSSTVGTFQIGANATIEASNLAAAITACNAAYSAVGATATSNGAVVTVDATPGTPGNSVVLTKTLSNFTLTPTNGHLAGGTDCADYPTTWYKGGSGFRNPPTFCYWGEDASGNATTDTVDSPSTVAANIAAAFNATSPLNTYILATASGATVTFTLKTGETGRLFVFAANFSAYSPNTGGTGGVLATVQPNALPAEYGASTTTASCANDFVVYPTGQAGGGSAANIIAFNELYSGCTNSPSPYWAYNTGTGEVVSTSPVLSNDATGSQVAFIESNGTTASLVILKWAPSTTDAINVPDTGLMTVQIPYYNGPAETCSAPCMVALPFGNGADDSNSSPYYDYVSDDIYVGDNNGNLHQFSGVFRGTPSESGSPSWPAKLGSYQLSSPVYDSTSGYIFVGDQGGDLYSVGSGYGSPVTTAGSLHASGLALADAIADGPLIDSTAEQVYFFFGDFAGSDAVFQVPATTTTNFSGDIELLGTGATGYYLYDGTFDNTYYTSATPATPTGNLYVMGNTGPDAGGGILYQVPISDGVIQTPNAIASVTSSGVVPWPSPLTEYYNTTAGFDYVLFSANSVDSEIEIGTNEYESGCTTGEGNGCILSFNVTTPTAVTFTGGQNYPSATGANGCWATGGISIDNSVSGDSDIYFVSLNGATAGSAEGPTSSQCTPTPSPDTIITAIQATQSNP